MVRADPPNLASCLDVKGTLQRQAAAIPWELCVPLPWTLGYRSLHIGLIWRDAECLQLPTMFTRVPSISELGPEFCRKGQSNIQRPLASHHRITEKQA